MPIPTRAEIGEPMPWDILDQAITQINTNTAGIATLGGDLSALDTRVGTAESDIDALELLIAQAGGRGPMARSGSNALFDLAAVCASGTYTAGAPSTTATQYVPFSLPRALSVSHLYCNVTTSASRSARLAIYSSKVVSGEDLPDAQLALVTASLSATGYAGGALGTPVALEAGRLYWVALAVLNTGSGTAQLSHTPAVNLGHSLGFSASSLGSPYLLRAESASAPANAGTTTLLTNVPPAVFARFS